VLWLRLTLLLLLLLLLPQDEGAALAELLKQGEKVTVPLVQEEAEGDLLARAEAEGLEAPEAEPQEAL
jgi:hypothetical protein